MTEDAKKAETEAQRARDRHLERHRRGMVVEFAAKVQLASEVYGEEARLSVEAPRRRGDSLIPPLGFTFVDLAKVGQAVEDLLTSVVAVERERDEALEEAEDAEDRRRALDDEFGSMDREGMTMRTMRPLLASDVLWTGPEHARDLGGMRLLMKPTGSPLTVGDIREDMGLARD